MDKYKYISNFKYFPHTEEDINLMLEKIGIKNIDELFSDIPDSVKVNSIDLDSSMSEIEVRKRLKEISSQNKVLSSFMGYGSYDVYTPSVIDAIVSRQEFLTSYTPYQPEISQGTLQYIFEYQSLICELTGVDVSNASMYDGATAMAESALICVSHTRRKKILASKTINHLYLEVLETYLKYKGIELVLIEEKDFCTDKDSLISLLDQDVAGVICQYPNKYGYVENFDYVSLIKNNKSLFILAGDISCYSLIKSPGELGCDIACGDAQALGIPKSNGGPYIGYLAVTEPLMRKIPGRIVGMTKDSEGKRGYVLTLQAREQHIRREKATSNICSNESLMALHTVIYASLLGKKGLLETQKACYYHSHYLRNALLKNKHFTSVSDENVFIKEFVLKTDYNIDKLNEYLEREGYIGGFNLGNSLCLFCATETKDIKEIDKFVQKIGEYHE